MDRAALLDRGALEIARGRLAEAEAIYREILDEVPTDAETLSNLGAVFNAAKCHAAAEAACRAALASQPGYWAALANLGTALHRQQRYEEAVAAYVAGLTANPGNASACTNLAVALNEQWRMEESLRMHNAALRLAPDDPEIRNNRALALLMAGDFETGFAELEWRWRALAMKPHGMAGPQWRGENPEGRTILLHDEGGFGDTLQFVRYAPMLASRGASVVLQVQPPLLRLIRQSMPEVAQVLARGEPLPPYDAHCPMLSLAHCFGTRLETVPAALPYLRPDPAAAMRWRMRLDGATAGQGLRVGLVWAGASRPDMPEAFAMNRRRSLSLAQLAPLAEVPGVSFISLQLDAAEAVPTGMSILDPMAEMADFADTAALVANLDLVIAADTAVAHLAGALGRPVWVMSRYDACWRWLAGRRDNPWYPSLRFYRQPRPGDWDSVIASVADDLRLSTGERKESLLL
jgi:tetratricopeptide (TPR) repeat protein